MSASGSSSLSEAKMYEHEREKTGGAVVPELPSGPLDVYRKRASFSWRDMVLLMEGEDVIQFKVNRSLL